MIVNSTQPPRRKFLRLVGGIAATLQSKFVFAAGKTVRIVEFNPAGIRAGVAELEKVQKPIDDWKKQLTPEQFAVTRQAATERPGTGKYANNHDDGLDRCICCDTVLFDSKTKFESGTGWPSFWQPIAKENVTVKKDNSLGIVREEVLCSRCEAHLGHLFDDGPPPTHLRYCMNSASLNFAPRRKA